MTAKRRLPIKDKDLKGLKYFKVLGSQAARTALGQGGAGPVAAAHGRATAAAAILR